MHKTRLTRRLARESGTADAVRWTLYYADDENREVTMLSGVSPDAACAMRDSADAARRGGYVIADDLFPQLDAPEAPK